MKLTKELADSGVVVRLPSGHWRALYGLLDAPADARFTTVYLPWAEQAVYRDLEVHGFVTGVDDGDVKLTPAALSVMTRKTTVDPA